MQIAIAPWLRPTDTLGAISGGAQAGLGLRAQMEREAARVAEENLARERMAQAQAMEQQKMEYGLQEMMLRAQMEEERQKAQMEANRLDNETRFKIAEAGNVLRQSQYNDTRDYRNRMAAAREADVLNRNQTAAEKLRLDAIRLSTPKPVYDTVSTTEEIPEVLEQPADPGRSGFLGMFKRPATPAVPYQAPKKITRTQKILANPEESPAPVAEEEITETVQESSSVKAGQIIKGPDGKMFKAKKDAALPDGYSIVQ